MKIGISFLSRVRSLFGVEIGHGVNLQKNEEGVPTLYRTIEITIGFVFGWVYIAFNHGGSYSLEEVSKSMFDAALEDKKISTHD